MLGETWNTYRILMGKPLEKQPLVRPRRCDDNIKMDIKEIGCEDGRW
jgi:hypothetical protein